MFSTRVLAIILGVVVVVGGIFAVRTLVFKPGPQENNIVVQKPWIEVVRPGVFEVKASSSDAVRELVTGDQLTPPTTLETKDNGLANIYFPDGSVARLDSKSRLLVSQGELDEKSGKLVVKMRLFVGRVWSKILELATPDSTWEVKTANTVATVRGTAFGVEYNASTSRVIGSEHKVSVAISDPKTGEVIQGSEQVVDEGKLIKVEDKDALKVKSGTFVTSVIHVVDAGTALQEDWVKRSRDADEELNKKIQGLESGKQNINFQDIKVEYRNDLIKTFQNQIETQSKLGTNQQSTTSPSTVTTTPVSASTTSTKLQTTSGGTTSVTSSASPVKVVLSTSANLSNITEGDNVIWTATLVMSDGSKRDVTKESRWQVIGSIGSITSAGVFTPLLDLSVAELGQAPGSIGATWKDPSTGKEFFGPSAIFNVNAKVVAPATPLDG